MKKYTRENKKFEKLLRKSNITDDELWTMLRTVIASTSQTAKHFCRLYDGYNNISDHAYDQKDRLLEAIGFDMYDSMSGNICPNMIVRTNVQDGLETDLMEMSMQDVSGWKHPKACTWASYMAGWETPYGVYLSPVEVGYLTAPEDSCLLLSDGRDTARIDLGDAYLGYAFEGITEDGIVDPIRILDASEVKWGNRRKVRLSNKVIEKVIKRVETQFNRSIR